MTREEKLEIIETLKEQLAQYSHFYITDISGLNAAATYELRKECFKKDIKLYVVKNTLMKKALKETGGQFDELFSSLKGSSAIMFCNVANMPGKLIKDFRKSNPSLTKPALKGAYVSESIYVGEHQLDTLASIKSKEELIADIVALLKSPMQTVLGQLQSGGHTIAGVVKTLQERN
ncbi:MAG TPA: 50S ribosomal protein L10 [Salinivirgaceae bacterium]|nr:50S ribosomal protein L10 [Salinivirgaceae bacterium]